MPKHVPKLFIGHPDRRVTVRVQSPLGTVDERPLAPCHVVYNHSPDGFNWGYGGSGPAQLALALACNLYGLVIGRNIYQLLKVAFVEKLPQGFPWMATDIEIMTAIEEFLKKEHPQIWTWLEEVTRGE